MLKQTLVLAAFMAVAFGASLETRQNIESWNTFTETMNTLNHLVDVDKLKAELQVLADLLGSDPTEAYCEKTAKATLSGLLVHAAPLICHSFQSFVQHFNIVPDPVVGKRLLLDSLDQTVFKQELQKLLDVVGSDPTEQYCEQEIKKLFGSTVLVHSAPLVCHSFQDLVQKFNLVPTSSKRFVLDSLAKFLDVSTLKSELQTMLDVLGSDPTEQACEQEGHKLVSSTSLAAQSIPLICHSFQELLHHFNIHPDATTTAASA